MSEQKSNATPSKEKKALDDLLDSEYIALGAHNYIISHHLHMIWCDVMRPNQVISMHLLFVER